MDRNFKRWANNRQIYNLIYSDNSYSNNYFGETFIDNNKKNFDVICNNGLKFKLESIREYRYFFGAQKKVELKLIPKKIITDLSYMFASVDNLSLLSNLSYLNISEVINMKKMFYKCEM